MTQPGPGDMLIRLRLDGLDAVTRGFARLRDAGHQSARAIGSGSQVVLKDLNRIVAVAGFAARGLTLVGGAAATIGGAGIAALSAGLAKVSENARQVADELDELQSSAVSFGVDAANRLGGLRFAAGNAGADADAVDESVAILKQLSEDALDGDEAAREIFSLVGARYGDIIDDLGKVRSGDELFLNIADRFSQLGPEVNRTALAMRLFGEDAGPKLVGLLNQGRSGIESYLTEYERLTGFTDEDFALAGAVNAQEARRQEAFNGFRASLARGFFPALIEVDKQVEEFFVAQNDAAETLGATIGAFFVGVTPKLLEVARAFALVASGQGQLVAEGPLKTGVESTIALIESLGIALLDVLEYLTTGDMQAAPPWLQSTVQFGRDAGEAFRGLRSWFTDISTLWELTLKPALDQLVGAVQYVYGLLGVDEPASQLAITAALVLFGGTVTTLIGKLALLASGLVSAGAAAAGIGAAGAGTGGVIAGAAAAAAPVAAVVGSGVAVGASAVSTRNLERQLQEAARVTKELARTEGEVFAAAYYKTVVEALRDEFSVGSFTNDLANFLSGGLIGADFDAELAKVDLVLSTGGVEESAAGVRRALADLGLTRAEDGAISGAAGYDLAARLKISEVELTPEAQAQLDELKARAAARGIVPPGAGDRISARYASGGVVRGPGTGTSDSILARLSNGEFVMRAAAVRRYGLGLLEGLNDLRLPGFALGGLVSPAAVPAPAMLMGASGTPVHLTLPGLGEYQLSARADVAEDLLRAARKAKRSRL